MFCQMQIYLDLTFAPGADSPLILWHRAIKKNTKNMNGIREFAWNQHDFLHGFELQQQKTTTTTTPPKTNIAPENGWFEY